MVDENERQVAIIDVQKKLNTFSPQSKTEFFLAWQASLKSNKLIILQETNVPNIGSAAQLLQHLDNNKLLFDMEAYEQI